MSEWTPPERITAFFDSVFVNDLQRVATTEDQARHLRRTSWVPVAYVPESVVDALRARVEELEAQIDAALATTWTPDDEGGWGTDEDTLYPDRASALADLVPYWRAWGDEAWDKAGRAEAALLSGGSQEPRPDTGETCPDCDGSGRQRLGEKKIVCTRCDGSGRVERCPHCDRHGQAWFGGSPSTMTLRDCSKCGGTKIRPDTKETA